MNIFVIIVLYNPTEEDLQHTKHVAEIEAGFIIDNSEKASLPNKIGKMSYICNKKNLGIAEAQNIALQKIILEDSESYVVFFDQDSRFIPTYAKDIVAEYIKIKKEIPNLGLLGPTVLNKETGKEYKSAFHNDAENINNFIPRRDVISSGSCVDINTLKKVGLNDSALFIDFVDFEWCWRAQKLGFICGITANICIEHKVGSNEISIGNHHVIISSPIREYYSYRNYQWLVRRNYVPLQWKIAQGVKQFLRFLYFPFVVKNGIKHCKYMILGFKDGILNRQKIAQ